MKRLFLLIALAVMVVLGGEALAQGPSLEVVPVEGKRIFIPSSAATGPPGIYVWSHSAKFICGTISPSATGNQTATPLVPGVYSTAVNIRNVNYRPITIRKIAVETKSESEPAGQIGNPVSVDLVANGGLEVDCSDIIRILFGPNTTVDLTKQFVKGFVAIESVPDIEVVGVYTAHEAQ